MREGVQHRARLLARNRNHDRAPSKRNGKMLGVPSRRLPRHLSPALKPSRAAEGYRGWTLPEEGGKESAYPPRGARGRKSTRWRLSERGGQFRETFPLKMEGVKDPVLLTDRENRPWGGSFTPCWGHDNADFAREGDSPPSEYRTASAN